MRIIDRLLKYLSYQKITAYSFERTCQVANGYLKKQEKGKGSVGSDILQRIHQNYPDLSLVWLITGKEEMLLTVSEQDKNQLREAHQSYTREEWIGSLTGRIALLESSLADKNKIIAMLELRLSRKKGKA